MPEKWLPGEDVYQGVYRRAETAISRGTRIFVLLVVTGHKRVLAAPRRSVADTHGYGLIHGLEDLPLNALGKRFGFDVAGVVEKVQTHFFRVRHK